MTAAQANSVLVDALSSSLRRGGNALADVPDLLKRILREEAWREFATARGELVRHQRFVHFVTTPPTAGLGADIDLVRRIISADVEAIDLLDQVLTGRQGARNDLLDNIQEVEAPNGTSRDAALRRLRKDAPALHAEVLAGNMSAHAAMIEAGFRRKTVSVPVDRPEAVAESLRRNLAPADLEAVIALLTRPPRA